MWCEGEMDATHRCLIRLINPGIVYDRKIRYFKKGISSMPISADDIRDTHKLREALGQYESGGSGGSCFGVSDPSHLRPPFNKSPARSEYSRALAFRNKIAECFQTFVASEGKDTDTEKEIVNSVPAGLYEHFKSAKDAPKFYVVHAVGFIQNKERTPLVSYTALYPPHAGKMTHRYLFDEQEGFLSPIQRDVYTGARFCLVAPLTQKQITILLQYVGELAVITDSIKFRLHAGELLKKFLPL